MLNCYYTAGDDFSLPDVPDRYRGEWEANADWPFYENYVPDHFDRLDVALEWLTEHGYEPVFFHEGLLGGPEPDA